MTVDLLSTEACDVKVLFDCHKRNRAYLEMDEMNCFIDLEKELLIGKRNGR